MSTEERQEMSVDRERREVAMARRQEVVAMHRERLAASVTIRVVNLTGEVGKFHSTPQKPKAVNVNSH